MSTAPSPLPTLPTLPDNPLGPAPEAPENPLGAAPLPPLHIGRRGGPFGRLGHHAPRPPGASLGRSASQHTAPPPQPITVNVQYPQPKPAEQPAAPGTAFSRLRRSALHSHVSDAAKRAAAEKVAGEEQATMSPELREKRRQQYEEMRRILDAMRKGHQP